LAGTESAVSWRTRSSAPANASTIAWPERWHLPAISQGGVGLTRSFYRADDVLRATLSSSPAYRVLARMTVVATRDQVGRCGVCRGFARKPFIRPPPLVGN